MEWCVLFNGVCYHSSLYNGIILNKTPLKLFYQLFLTLLLFDKYFDFSHVFCT